MTPIEIALAEAAAAAARGEVPVGAVVTDATGAVLAQAGNEVEARCGPTAPPDGLYLTGVGYPQDPFGHAPV